MVSLYRSQALMRPRCERMLIGWGRRWGCTHEFVALENKQHRCGVLAYIGGILGRSQA